MPSSPIGDERCPLTGDSRPRIGQLVTRANIGRFVVDVEEAALLHQHGPVQGGEHHPQVGVANMDPDQRAYSGCQPEGRCRSPRPARA